MIPSRGRRRHHRWATRPSLQQIRELPHLPDMVLPFGRRGAGMAEDKLRPEEGQDCAGRAELGAHDACTDRFLRPVGERDEFDRSSRVRGFTTIFGMSP